MVRGRRQHILFRVDADPQSGMGHLMRSVALAEALKHRGWVPVFCLFTQGSLAGRWLVRRKLDLVRLRLKSFSDLGKEQDLRQLLHWGRKFAAHAVILDSYAISSRYVNDLKRSGQFVACIDDHAEQVLSVDAIINGNVGGEELNYGSSNQTRLLLGSRYALIREEFRRLREKYGLPPVKSSVEHVLVSLGGSDPLGQTVATLQQLKDVEEPFSLHVLVTSQFHHLRELRLIMSGAKREIHLYCDCEPRDLADVMRRCDLAITAAGVTSYELACLGIPFIVMKLYNNQRFVYRSLVRKRMALPASKHGSRSSRFFPRQFTRLLRSSELRATLRRNAAKEIDGRGPERIADALCCALEEFHGPPVSPYLRALGQPHFGSTT